MLRLLGEAAGNCGLAGRLFGVLEKSTAMNNQLRTGADLALAQLLGRSRLMHNLATGFLDLLPPPT
jgi:hypothetical protein